MHAAPTPTIVFDTFWKFAAERQETYFRRLVDPVGPWTRDPVIAAHRFTNAYRVADRVSQYLVAEVQYGPGRSTEPQEVFYRTLLYKIFNRIETFEALERQLGPISWAGMGLEPVKRVLDDLVRRGERIYTAAYVMPSPPFGHLRKHDNHIAQLAKMMADRAPERVCQAPSLKAVYELLRGYPGMGPFLAFQFAIDLNYSPIANFEEASFVVAGPGALDGLSKCFSDFGGLSPDRLIHWITDRQEAELEARGIAFRNLFGRRARPIDAQNLLCEISKYARVAHPDVAGIAGRTRIKQSYRPSGAPMPCPVFPPKWGLQVGKVPVTPLSTSSESPMSLQGRSPQLTLL